MVQGRDISLGYLEFTDFSIFKIIFDVGNVSKIRALRLEADPISGKETKIIMCWKLRYTG